MGVTHYAPINTFMTTWTYKGKPFEEASEDHFGFVYLIEHKETGKAYIGKKQFKMKRTLPPLKGKKRKRVVYKESNWKEYWGSSDFLKEDIERYGKECYTRTILILCTSKSSLTYNEIREQFNRNVLYERLENGDKKYYNGNISNKHHYRKEIEEDLKT